MFRAEVSSALVSARECDVSIGWADVHLFLSVSSVSAHSLLCHCGKEGIRACGFDEV